MLFFSRGRFLIFLLPVFLSACFSRYFLSEEEIKRYFDAHPPHPNQYMVCTPAGDCYVAETPSSDSAATRLLLIHGAPGAWYVYRNMLSDPMLLQRFRILAPDRPGYHRSRKGRKTWSVIEQAQMLAPLLGKDSLHKTIVLGRSYGVPVAAALAALYPQQVKGLLLISPASDPQSEKYWWFSRIIPLPPFRWMLIKPLRTAADEKIRHRRDLSEILPLWKNIRCKTIVASGGKDWIVDRKNALFTDSALTHAPHETIFLPENGHLITQERPDLVREWLFKLDTVSAHR